MTQTSNASASTTTDVYSIQTSDIRATLFKRKCQDIVRKMNHWTLQESNYPVEYHEQGRVLDIWAERHYDPARIVLPIGCNADRANWIFFPKASYQQSNHYLQTLALDDQNGSAEYWTVRRQLARAVYNLIVADDAHTESSREMITEVAAQTVIATQALIQQEYRILKKIEEDSKSSQRKIRPAYFNFLFFPTIITTAKLYTYEYQGEDTDFTASEVSLENDRLSPIPYLIFDYPVPVTLQAPPQDLGMGNKREELARIARTPIFVVNSESFSEFLQQLQWPQQKTNFDGWWYQFQFEPGK